MATPICKSKTIATILCLSERRVHQLVKDGIIPKAERGKYDLVACVRGYIKFLQERAMGNNTGTIDTHIEKARLTKAKADIAEMEADVKRKILVLIDDVAHYVEKMLNTFRSRLLNFPKKYAAEVFGCNSIAEVDEVLTKGIEEALIELSGFKFGQQDKSERGIDNDYAGNPSKKTKAATKVKRKRVGK